MRRSPLGLLLPLAFAALLFSSCSAGDDAPPARECRSLIWAKPETQGASVLAMGSWDSWSSAVPLLPYGDDGWMVRAMDLAPGEYGYRLIEQGTTHLDPYSPQSGFQGDLEVSLLVVPDCGAPEIRIDSVLSGEGGEATVEGMFLTAHSGAPLDPSTVKAHIEDGRTPLPSRANPDDGRFAFSAAGLEQGKHTMVIEAKDRAGRAAPPARVAVWVKPSMSSWADGVLYQIMIDRFRGPGGAALSPPPSPGTRAGGTLDGVRAEIERGTFEELGVTALWLSPVYTNPDGLFPGRDGHMYEGYHGYWPLESRGVDPHIGGAAALHAVIEAAHRRGIRVLLDFVPNHLYEKNARYLEHQGDGWFNDTKDKCLCGDPGCGWGDHILTCWFSSYLPDVRFQQPEQMRLGAADARWWMETFDADGIRIDAVPMMPRAASRRMIAALRATEEPRDALFTIGEVYTGPGAGGMDVIRYYLGPDGLDAAFDFPLMWATRDAFATQRQGFTAVESVLSDTEEKLEGSGAILGRMLDNHDTSRFISEADGTAFGDPWANPLPQPTASAPYRRQEMASAFLFTLPGLPILYYGDEIGLGGASDPDSRRVMPSRDAISPDQKHLRDTIQRLSAVRRCLKSLRTGARVPLSVSADTYAYLRDAGDGLPAIALFSRMTSATMIALPQGITPAGQYQDAFTGVKVNVSGGGSIPMDPESFKLLIPASLPCAPNPK
jgi:glycosidase